MKKERDMLHVINTKRLAEHSPGMKLWVMGGAPQKIEEQEKQGQRMLVKSDTFPTDIDPEEKKALEVAGVKFLGGVDGDELFQYVELPKGWKKEATDHSMWSKLIDDQGRERAMIFYKAAFYDRSAFLRLS